MKSKSEKKQRFEQEILGSWLILFAIFIIWLWIVCKHYYSLNPVRLDHLNRLFQWQMGEVSSGRLRLLLDYVLSLILLTMVLVVAYFLGKKGFKLLGIDFATLLEEIVFSIGLGFGILAYATLLLGLLGLLYAHLFYGLLGVIFILAVGEIVKSRKPIERSTPQEGRTAMFSFACLPMCIILGIFVVVNFIMAFTPELFYDSLAYHLGVPNYYIIKHKICDMPYELTSYFPFNVEMLYTMALLLKEEGLPKLLHFSSGVLCLAAIFSFCKRYFNVLVGIVACAIFYSVPILAMNSWVSGNDVALSYFSALSIYGLINYFTCQPLSKNTAAAGRWFIASAIFSGIAMGSKYTAVFALFGIVILIMSYEYFKMSKRLPEIVKEVLIFGIIVLAIMSPWLLRNTIYTGNPVYPFLYKWLGGKNLIVYTSGNAMIPSGTEGLKFKDFFLSLWTTTMKGQDSMSFIGPIFLLFIPLVFFMRKESLVNYLILFSIATYIPWGMATFKFRYLLPAFPAISIIIGWSFAVFIKWIPKYLGKLMLIILAIPMATNLISILGIIDFCYSPLNVLTGSETRDHYLSLTRPGYPYPSYGAFKYINDNLSEDTKIMLIGEAKIHYLKRDFLSNNVHNFTPVVEWTKMAKNGDELYERIRKERVTHILVNRFEATRTLGLLYLNWNEEEIKIFDEFWQKYIEEIFAGYYGVHLFRILSPEESRKPHRQPRNYLYDLFYQQKVDETKSKKEEEQILGYKTILEKNPQAIPVRQELGQIYLRKGMWDEALEQYQLLLKMGINVYSQLGYLYAQKKDYDRALNMLQEAVRIEPGSPEVHRNLGILYFFRGEKERAIGEIRKAIEVDPANQEYRNLLRRMEMETVY